MAIYLIEGKLGSGKSLSVVGRLRDALRQGRRVVTNLDLHLEHLVGEKWKGECIRIPDKPCAEDLASIGHGNPTMDEEKNGIIALDELGSWLNARAWGDKERQPVLDWLIHSRKKGWDVYFICQNIQQVDKQLRESLVEYRVICRRLDRLKVPIFSFLFEALTLGYVKLKLPRLHLAFVRYGVTEQSILVERWIYRANDLFPAYNTRQVFVDRRQYPPANWLAVEGALWQLGNQKPDYDSPAHTFHYINTKRQKAKPSSVRLSAAQVSPAQKLPYVKRLMNLPPDERVLAWKSLQAAGS